MQKQPKTEDDQQYWASSIKTTKKKLYNKDREIWLWSLQRSSMKSPSNEEAESYKDQHGLDEASILEDTVLSTVARHPISCYKKQQ